MAKRRAPAAAPAESASDSGRPTGPSRIAAIVAVLRSTLRWSQPRVSAALRGCGRAAVAVGTAAWRRRALVLGLAVRVAFWAALALWTATAIEVVGGGPFDVELAVGRFAAGALVCAFAVVLAAARPVRWASWALGSLHGASATVLWLLVQA